MGHPSYGVSATSKARVSSGRPMAPVYPFLLGACIQLERPRIACLELNRGRLGPSEAVKMRDEILGNNDGNAICGVLK